MRRVLRARAGRGGRTCWAKGVRATSGPSRNCLDVVSAHLFGGRLARGSSCQDRPRATRDVGHIRIRVIGCAPARGARVLAGVELRPPSGNASMRSALGVLGPSPMDPPCAPSSWLLPSPHWRPWFEPPTVEWTHAHLPLMHQPSTPTPRNKPALEATTDKQSPVPWAFAHQGCCFVGSVDIAGGIAICNVGGATH